MRSCTYVWNLEGVAGRGGERGDVAAAAGERSSCRSFDNWRIDSLTSLQSRIT